MEIESFGNFGNNCIYWSYGDMTFVTYNEFVHKISHGQRLYSGIGNGFGSGHCFGEWENYIFNFF